MQSLHSVCEVSAALTKKCICLPVASSPAVTVQCTRDGQFVVVVARDATLPHIDVDSVSLLEPNGPSCNPVDFTSSFAIFQFPVTACGTTIKEVCATQMKNPLRMERAWKNHQLLAF